MKEIEVLVQVFGEKEEILGKLEIFSFKGVKKTTDIYFFDPLRDNLKVKDSGYPEEWLRVREKDAKYYVTYKKDVFDEEKKWLHSDEYETEVKDLEVMKKIIESLGFKELVRIHNVKHTYETDKYEIVFEEVEGLGFFLEVESINGEEDSNKVRNEIQGFIDSLGLNVSSDVQAGKPELMLKKMREKK